MGSDRHMESRMLAENNFWPARSLLEEALESLELGDVNRELRSRIRDFLKRTSNE